MHSPGGVPGKLHTQHDGQGTIHLICFSIRALFRCYLMLPVADTISIQKYLLSIVRIGCFVYVFTFFLFCFVFYFWHVGVLFCFGLLLAPVGFCSLHMSSFFNFGAGDQTRTGT